MMLLSWSTIIVILTKIWTPFGNLLCFHCALTCCCLRVSTPDYMKMEEAIVETELCQNRNLWQKSRNEGERQERRLRHEGA
ncbi:hypothetical protein VNO78_05696 [Psophocarpus tetragonolobus]|uniref:Uncharacterized protein n=1 Tax=Psophocarpus tetragonolobus TaxID=3891 RepID=A0AAN9XQY4_PSOTE